MRKLTLGEAKFRAAQLTMAFETARQKWMKLAGIDEDSEEDQEPIKTPESEEAFEFFQETEEALSEFFAELGTHPDIRKHLICALVYFSGTTEPSWVAENRKPTEVEVVGLLKGVDQLAVIVKDWLASKNIEANDFGGGTDGWDIGVLCSYEEAIQLCDLAHKHFNVYIETELLTITLRLGHFKFKDFTYEQMMMMLSN